MIRFEHVSRVFHNDGREFAAVNDVSLEIEKGEIFGIIGFSGAGKSTLVRCINLLERPTSGKVFIGDEELTAMSPAELRQHRKKIGMIFQQFNLFASRTVYDNVSFPLKGSNLTKEQKDKKVRDLLKLVELEEQRLSFEEIVKQIEEFRSNVHTYFVLDNLDTLRKNGRLTGVKALVASTLSIKPIMAGDKGCIVQRGQSVGMKKALRRMAEIVLEEAGDTKERFLMITHCNAPDRAETMKKLLMEKAEFKGCLIMDTRGVSSMYANDGGVIVTV